MADVWEFVNVDQHSTVYADGTVVPQLDADVVLNGQKVGRINVHMHKHRGPDRVTDTSFGFTGVVNGPPNPGSG